MYSHLHSLKKYNNLHLAIFITTNLESTDNHLQETSLTHAGGNSSNTNGVATSKKSSNKENCDQEEIVAKSSSSSSSLSPLHSISTASVADGSVATATATDASPSTNHKIAMENNRSEMRSHHHHHHLPALLKFGENALGKRVAIRASDFIGAQTTVASLTGAFVEHSESSHALEVPLFRLASPFLTIDSLSRKYKLQQQ